MSGLKLIPASAGGGWQRRYCEHPPSVMLGIKFQASAFWVGGCLHPLFYIAPMGHVRARGSAGRAPRSHRGGRGFESLRVHAENIEETAYLYGFLIFSRRLRKQNDLPIKLLVKCEEEWYDKSAQLVFHKGFTAAADKFYRAPL